MSRMEDFLAVTARRVLPDSLLKYVPGLYYTLNKHRFRLFSRPVLTKETAKARARRQREGFFERFCTGHGIDIGYGGDPVVSGCDVWDIEHGDAQDLETIADGIYDFAYSSHLLEHLQDPARALSNWWRILKPGGYLILYVSDRELYEKKQTLPSRFSLDHRHFFLLDRDDPPDTLGMLPLLDGSLGSHEIIYAKLCDDGLTVRDPHRHSDGEYSIEIVARKSSPDDREPEA